MSPPNARIAIAWVLIAANVAVMILLIAVSDGLTDVGTALLLASFVVPGGLLTIKQPRNVEAWLLLIIGTTWALAFISPFDGGWVIPLGLMGTQLLLRFPNGSLLPSSRWRWFSGLSLAYLVLLAFVVTTGDPLSEDSGTINAFYISWVQPFGFLILLFPIVIGASVYSFVARFRHADPVEREQIRWIAWAAATVGVIYSVALLASLNSDWGSDAGPLLSALQFSALMSFALIPLSISVSVLKYRLYEIDRIISRSTSYAIVTGLLVVTYATVVTLTTRLVPDANNVAVAAATLAAAAIARPALRRVRAAVDRRFNQERYNAAQTVDEFGAHLRQTVRPEAISDDLIYAVQRVLEPSSARLWLRDSS